MLLLTGRLHGDVISEISDCVPVVVGNHSGGQLERFFKEFNGKNSGKNG
jgi:hypothetical protein